MVERVLMFDHFWLDLVGLVLSNLVCSVLIRDQIFTNKKEKKKKNNGLEYRVAAQLKMYTSYKRRKTEIKKLIDSKLI